MNGLGPSLAQDASVLACVQGSLAKPRRQSRPGPTLRREVDGGTVEPIKEGACRCASLRYTVSHTFGPVINCHCAFCRRVHGAALTTVAFVPRASVAWIRGESDAAIYSTPQGNRRYFCGRCASPMFNVGGAGDLAAIVVGSLQDSDQPPPWAHVNTESKAPWYAISDDLPKFTTWPAAQELRALADKHSCAWLPNQLLLPAV